MIVVVDASIAVMWFVEEADHHKAVALTESQNRLIAPDLIFCEVANVLRRKVRSGQISHQQASISVKNLNEAFQHIVQAEFLIEDAFNLAEQIDHSVYDVVYLACALRQPGSFLVTNDEKFRLKAIKAGYGEHVLNLEAAHTRFVTGQENDNG